MLAQSELTYGKIIKMKLIKRHRAGLYAIAIFISSCPHLFSQIKKDTIYVFYLGGQSNMQGYGKNADLPKELQKPFKDVMIFQGDSQIDDHPNGGNGKWDFLQPGHGSSFSTDGFTNTLSDKFGIELSFAKKIRETYPAKKIAIIKYTRNGSSLDSIGTNNFGSWDPDYKSKTGQNQYDYFLRTVSTAMSVRDINNDGIEDILIPKAILWMQGESDADKTEQIAVNYYSNFKRLMELMKAALHNNDLPIVIGKISDSEQDTDGKVWDYCEIIQYAQEKYIKNYRNTFIIRSTKNYKYSDKWHYNSAGYIDLGIEFSKHIKFLNK